MSVLEGASNYYEVLQIPRDATHEIIVQQFRALSMRCNPVRNPTNMQVNQLKFDEMCEAFEVLSNCKYFQILFYRNCFPLTAELKAIYDKYGEYGLKEGIIGTDGSKSHTKADICLYREIRRWVLHEASGAGDL
jgi:curved DNA-binding protein CbpA